jgi:hypothetical protein
MPIFGPAFFGAVRLWDTTHDHSAKLGPIGRWGRSTQATRHAPVLEADADHAVRGAIAVGVGRRGTAARPLRNADPVHVPPRWLALAWASAVWMCWADCRALCKRRMRRPWPGAAGASSIGLSLALTLPTAIRLGIRRRRKGEHSIRFNEQWRARFQRALGMTISRRRTAAFMTLPLTETSAASV